MPSPFPGMDPYLESHWGDVFAGLIVYACDSIQDQLPQSLITRIDERVIPFPTDGENVRISKLTSSPRLSTNRPILVSTLQETLTRGFGYIFDNADNRRVITVIELLTPAYKTPGDGMDAYLHRQRDLLDTGVNLVEIDLLRSGKHILAVPLLHIPASRRTPYMVCVRRAWTRDTAEIYPIHLAQKLPTIKIPLRQGDTDVPLDLQGLIEESYRKGGYDGTINHRFEPDPPLTRDEAEWVDELLRSKGLRPSRAAKRKRKRKPPGRS